jgi:hypothetical protein
VSQTLIKSRKTRHSPSVKKPLIDARIVLDPTLVHSKLLFTLQLAANQNPQNNAARLAVSLSLSFSMGPSSLLTRIALLVNGGWSVAIGLTLLSSTLCALDVRR